MCLKLIKSNFLAQQEGFDPRYGARPLRRAIQSKVEDAVAVEDDKLVVTK